MDGRGYLRCGWNSSHIDEGRVSFLWPAFASSGDGDSVMARRGRFQLKEQLTLREGEIHRLRELNLWPLQDSDEPWWYLLRLLHLLVYLFGWMLLLAGTGVNKLGICRLKAWVSCSLRFTKSLCLSTAHVQLRRRLIDLKACFFHLHSTI
ncbi:hypothetical protein DFS33DRAFT_904852 [Desarmillaria ectypa]|nr:hypothetical protein DFS33DRAFT_904852 [Desarmillaria ectypa]